MRNKKIQFCDLPRRKKIIALAVAFAIIEEYGGINKVPWLQKNL